MKKIFYTITFLIILSSQIFAYDHSYPQYRTLLNETVKNGLVDYKKLKTGSLLLPNALLEFSEVTQEEYNSFERSQKIAYLINAYNIYTIQGIVNKYPVKSIKDIGGFWNKTKHKVAGQMLSLDNIEHDNLRKIFHEERIHVAIVCASISCPELWNQPFTADSLDQQLILRSQSFATDNIRNMIDFEREELKLSKILKWYGKDFENKYSDGSIFPYLHGKKRAIANFIYQHLPKEQQARFTKSKFKVGYLSYNWGLNEQ